MKTFKIVIIMSNYNVEYELQGTGTQLNDNNILIYNEVELIAVVPTSALIIITKNQ